MKVFAYGTLMFPDIWLAVTGRRFEAARAVLPGFARFRVKDEVFPGIVMEKEAATSGILYQGVDRSSLRRLDAFEGELYRRIWVEVVLEDSNERARAATYEIAPACRHRLSRRPWDPEEFARKNLGAFRRSYPWPAAPFHHTES